MRQSAAAILIVLGLLAPSGRAAAFPAGVCPSVLGHFDLIVGVVPGTAGDCTQDVTITDATPGAPLTAVLRPDNSTAGIAYDSDDDVLVGVWNNSSGPVSSIHIQGSITTGFSANIFGFDGDGISIFTGAPSDLLGYAGPNNTFSFSFSDLSQGDVNFITPLAPGDTAYFSLEYPIAGGAVNGPPGGGGGQTGAPEPATLALLGTALAGLGLVRLRR